MSSPPPLANTPKPRGKVSIISPTIFGGHWFKSCLLSMVLQKAISRNIRLTNMGGLLPNPMGILRLIADSAPSSFAPAQMARSETETDTPANTLEAEKEEIHPEAYRLDTPLPPQGYAPAGSA